MTISMKMTAEQFLLLGQDPPGTRLELVHGDIIVSPRPSYEHYRADNELRLILMGHIKQHDLGELVGDVDTIFGQFDVRRPDIVFIAKARTRLRDRKKHGIRFAPDLCVEIVSPDSEVRDRVEKFELYAKHGVANYWIVDPLKRTFEAYSLRPTGLVKTVTGRDNDAVTAEPFPKLKIALKEIWPPDED